MGRDPSIVQRTVDPGTFVEMGIPIVNDPLYPEVLDVSIDDFSRPLQLLASEIAFTDPVDGAQRRFASTRVLPLVGAAE